MTTTQRSQQGMTLLEVLVALSIIALAGYSALQFQSYSADHLLALQQQKYSWQVAQNQLVMARLEDYQSLKSQRGDSQQGGMDFRWQRDVEAVDGFAMKRVIVQVRQRDGERQLAELTGYIASPQ